MTDRRRCVDMDHNFYLWQGERLSRLIFREAIKTRSVGLLRQPTLSKFPPEMALLCPGTGTDVPRSLEVRAGAEGETYGFTFEPESLCQVAVPDETELSTTLIHEVTGRFEFSSDVRGRKTRSRGRGVFEFLSFER